MSIAKHWWKILAVILVLYAIIGGMLLDVPNDEGVLGETIRNLYYHVSMWFGMIILLTASFILSIRYLYTQKLNDDFKAAELAHTATLLGLLGIITGPIWAKFTWGDWWTRDPKLNGAAIGMLIYLGYNVLRSSIDDDEKKARVAAVFNVFAYPLFLALIIVIPKMMTDDSIHPGNANNTGFSAYGSSEMRRVFYPAVFGWTLLAVWMAQIRLRLRKLEIAEDESDD